MKKIFLMVVTVALVFASTACAKSVGLVIVPVEPVTMNGEVVKAIFNAFSSEFPGYEILPVVSGDAMQAQNPISQTTATEKWDYGAMVRLEMVRLNGTVAFFGRKMAVTANTNIEIVTKDGPFFNQKFEGKAVGNLVPNAGPLYLKALNSALDAFKEAFKP